MSRLGTLATLVVFLTLPLGAQEVLDPLAPHFSGSTTLRTGFQNVNNDEGMAVIPGFSSEAPTTNLNLMVDGKISLPLLQEIRTADSSSSVRGVGYEVGIQTDLGKMLTYTGGSSRTSSDSTSSSYSLVQPMIDWYENNKARFGLPDNPFGASGWPTTAYGGLTANYQFLRGTMAERADEVAWTSQKWAQASMLYNDIKAKITIAIDQLASDVVATGPVDQYLFQNLSPEGKKKALKKQQAIGSFRRVTDGSNSNAALTGPQVTGAYIRVTNVLDFFDLRVDFLGATLKSGDLISSPRAAQSATGPLVSLSLANGVVPGLQVVLKADAVGGSPQVAESFDTSVLEYDPGDAAQVGLQTKVSWTSYLSEVNGEFKLSAGLLLPDVAQKPGSAAATASTSWTTTGDTSFQVALEGNWLRWADRYIEGDAAVSAGSAGLTAGVDWLGLAPHVKGLWKAAGYGGTGGNRTEDRLAGLSAQGDFESLSVLSGTLADAGLRFDPRYWLGQELVWTDVGFNTFGIGSDTAQGKGWYGLLGFSLKDALDLPLTGEVRAAGYTNSGRPVYADAASFPQNHLLTDVSLTSNLKLQPTKAWNLSVQLTQLPGASRRDSQRQISLNLLTAIQF